MHVISRYDPYSFKEMSGYKPEIKLEYVDNKGRQLNQKEVSPFFPDIKGILSVQIFPDSNF